MSLELVVGLVVVGAVLYFVYDRVINEKSSGGTGGGSPKDDTNEKLK